MGNNVACRIFKEQVDLINQLPESERAEVLLSAINNAFFQFENQFENQNECAYVSVSVSVSVSDSLSDISKCVLDLLKKNLVCKEFSTNYGGRRVGAGRKNAGKEDSKLFDAFVDLVIDAFEPGLKESQKEIWIKQNKSDLNDILRFCDNDIEKALITINKCFAPLKREGLNYSYKAVVRNLSLYYAQAMKVIESGKQVKFTQSQKELIGKASSEEKL